MNLNLHKRLKDNSVYCGVVGGVTVGRIWTDPQRAGVDNTCALCEGLEAVPAPPDEPDAHDGNIWSR